MGRMVRPLDFQRVLGTTPWARSVHFAIHHLPQSPGRTAAKPRAEQMLSTAPEQGFPQGVDDCPAAVPAVASPDRCWLGMVVPKRHAKRSVTRSLLKRQIRQAVGAAHADGRTLQPGMWVVRLRTPIDKRRFPSAASDALRTLVHAELEQVMRQALARCHA
jgi:ribonuclease P protein component